MLLVIGRVREGSEWCGAGTAERQQQQYSSDLPEGRISVLPGSVRAQPHVFPSWTATPTRVEYLPVGSAEDARGHREHDWRYFNDETQRPGTQSSEIERLGSGQQRRSFSNFHRTIHWPKSSLSTRGIGLSFQQQIERWEKTSYQSGHREESFPTTARGQGVFGEPVETSRVEGIHLKLLDRWRCVFLSFLHRIVNKYRLWQRMRWLSWTTDKSSGANNILAPWWWRGSRDKTMARNKKIRRIPENKFIPYCALPGKPPR